MSTRLVGKVLFFLDKSCLQLLGPQAWLPPQDNHPYLSCSWLTKESWADSVILQPHASRAFKTGGWCLRGSAMTSHLVQCGHWPFSLLILKVGADRRLAAGLPDNRKGSSKRNQPSVLRLPVKEQVLHMAWPLWAIFFPLHGLTSYWVVTLPFYL